MSLESGKFTILHLSDVHATTGELLYGQVDGLARLEQVAEYAVSAGITPEAVVVTGDLIQRGNPEAYPALAEALTRVGDRVKAPVFTILGNHDDPASAHCLDGHNAHHYRVLEVGPVRFVLLDSSTGRLDDEQLAWLSATLANDHSAPGSMGTVVAVHHAPVPSPLPTLSKLGLGNADAFGTALAGSDVRTVLAGHYHHPMSATFQGVPVFVGPSLAYHQVMNAGPDHVSGHDLAMFSLVHLTPTSVGAAPVSLLATDPLFSSPAPHTRHLSPLVRTSQPTP